MIANSEAFPNITRLPYSLYIPSSLLNSLLDNNFMHKSTEDCLNQTCFSHRNTGFFWEKESKIKCLCDFPGKFYFFNRIFDDDFVRHFKYH